MTPKRREFIKRFGIALGSLMAARCALPIGDDRATEVPVSCYTPVFTSMPTPTEPSAQQAEILTAVARGDEVDPEAARRALSAFYREQLRACWFRLDWLAEEARDWEHPERGDEARDTLLNQHQEALDQLVAQEALEALVARQIKLAFSEAVYHVWRANCGITCYEPMPGPEYTPSASHQLVGQAELLEDLADDDAIDEQAVAQAQAAVERDIAFLSLSAEEEQALYDQLEAAADKPGAFPTFDDVDLEVPPEDVEAARFLVEVLLGRGG